MAVPTVTDFVNDCEPDPFPDVQERDVVQHRGKHARPAQVITGMRLYCWKHTAVHTMELADVERLVYALGATAIDAEDLSGPCLLEVLNDSLVGSGYQYIDLSVGRREDCAEWVNPDA